MSRYHLMNGKFCGEAWDAISRYVYTALQGGSIMHKWTNDERMMIACCNDGTRPVIFRIVPKLPVCRNRKIEILRLEIHPGGRNEIRI